MFSGDLYLMSDSPRLGPKPTPEELELSGARHRAEGAAGSASAPGEPPPNLSAPSRGGEAAPAFISISLCKSILYGAFVWARRALNRPLRRFLARAVRGRALLHSARRRVCVRDATAAAIRLRQRHLQEDDLQQ